HRDHLCIPCSKIEQGIQSRGSKFDENYSLRWVSSAWTSTGNHTAALWAEFLQRKYFVMFAWCGTRRMGPLRG
ncbi:hypothetical protein, partial [Burkholderia vietnamiensis]